jgi:hypothetical protein
VCKTPLAEVFFFPGNIARKLVDGAVLMWKLLFQSQVMVPENLLVFWWRVVDDVNDRPVENPKRRFDEYNNKFSLSYETKVCQSSRKRLNSRR